MKNIGLSEGFSNLTVVANVLIIDKSFYYWTDILLYSIHLYIIVRDNGKLY